MGRRVSRLSLPYFPAVRSAGEPRAAGPASPALRKETGRGCLLLFGAERGRLPEEPSLAEGDLQLSQSLELLQGLAPYYEPGSKSPRDTVPLAKGGERWYELKAWYVDPEFMWYEAPKVQDFWVQEAAQ